MASVSSQEEKLRQAETAILATIGEPISAKELVGRLKPQFNDEYPIRAAIWFLIGRGDLKITRDQNHVLLARS